MAAIIALLIFLWAITNLISNFQTLDRDGDGLTDQIENIFSLDPTDSDTDHDGIDDKEEYYYWKERQENESRDELAPEGDCDGDGIPNILDEDSDGDGELDGDEIEDGTDPADPDSDDVYYYIDWGDGTITEWDGPYNSNEEVNYRHTWTTTDTFTVKAKAKDIFDAESDWSEQDIIVPRTKIRIYNQINRFLNDIINFFPFLKLIIQGLG